MNHINFHERSCQAELMDGENISFEEFSQCLGELEVINHLTLAYRPTLKWMNIVLAGVKKETVTILDVGSGGGDMLRKIRKWADKRDIQVELTGVDLNPYAKQSSLLKSGIAGITFETSDIFNFAPDRQFDFVISSLFTHHLPEPELLRFVGWMEKHAKRGWFINDLHRHPAAYYFIKYAVRIFSRNRLIIHDAPVSVARAFSRQDWTTLLQKGAVPANQFAIKWFFPFRYGVARYK